MTLSDYLYEEIKTDLKRDYPKIDSIEKDENKIIIRADNDTLWEIFEVLYKGMENIEFNLDNEDTFIIINF